MNKIGNIFLILLFSVFISIPVILPYISPGFFPTHDGEWAVVRLADMFRTLRDFQFPPRFSGALNFGYGYPLFNFAYPFPYYLGTFIYFLVGSFVNSIKIIFASSVALSAFFMYFASKEVWKSSLAGFISAIVYVYLPYRMVDLYVRGSIGESISFVLFPLIVLLSFKLFSNPFSRAIAVILPISIAILVLTHNIMTVLFLPILVILLVGKAFIEKEFKFLQTIFLSIVLGLSLSAFFWFPALYEKGNIKLQEIPIADRNLYFVNISNLVVPSWGYAPPTEEDGFSYQIGISQLVVFLFGMGLLLFNIAKNKTNQTPAIKLAILISSMVALCILMMFSFTSIIWKTIPLLSEINYPWTLLSQVGLLISLFAGFIAIQSRLMQYLIIIVVLAGSVFVFNYAKPSEINNRGEDFYITNEGTTTSSDELMPLWVKEKPIQRFEDKVEILSGNAQIQNLKYNSKRIEFDYTSTEDPVFRINTIYYPGWSAYLNNEKVDINYDNDKGVMDVNASQYRDRVVLIFSETLPRVIANVVSIGAVLIISFILLRPLLLFRS